MKKELEEALRNVDAVCSNARLTREEHAVLARNVKLIHDTLVEAEINAKPKKEKKDGDNS